jgi:glycosyltransferase involved in cell wall biosynthesis
MKILFLTLFKMDSFTERGIYTDLLKKFEDEGHTVCVVCPNERREKKETELIKNKNSKILKVKTFNIQKTNLIEKGIATLAIEHQFLNGVKKYFSDIKFDLVLYSTPPITFTKVINYIKRRDGAYSYLLLKDIFPQNAVDMKMLKKNGLLHKFFLSKERKLYESSDTIGCLSQANVDFLKIHNPYLDFRKIEVNPNSISPSFKTYSQNEVESIRLQYSIPIGKKIFVYGGNLGKPQGLDFLLETILQNKRTDVFFLLVGTGTEFNRIQKWFKEIQPQNAMLLAGLPKSDYDRLLRACDVGLIFLHKDFTIPNYPSRLLSYLEMKMPVIAATDPNADIGSDIEKNECGYWVVSGNSFGIQTAIDNLMIDDQRFAIMKENAWKFLNNEFTVDRSFALIKEKLNV